LLEGFPLRMQFKCFHLIRGWVCPENFDKIPAVFVKIDRYPEIFQDIRDIRNHLAGVELETLSGKGSDIAATDRIFFDDEKPVFV